MDCIHESRRDGGQTRFSDPSEWLVKPAHVEEVRTDFCGRSVYARDFVVVKVRLLDLSRLEADLAQRRKTDALHDGTLELRAHAVRIDHRAAVKGDIDPRDA